MFQAFTRVIHAIVSLTALIACAPAQAQDWPGSRPIRIIVAALPGSSPDLTARYVADQLAKQTGGSFAIVNKAGGLGIPALMEVAQAPADGTTLLVGNINTNGLLPALHPKKFPAELKSALQPITMLSDGPSVFISAPKAPSTFKNALAAWKSNPGKYAYFAAGKGLFGHVWFSKLQTEYKLDLLLVPVKGSMEALQLLREGSVQHSYLPLASIINQIRSKEAQPLFVSTPTRLPEFPDVPTLREVGLSPDYELNTWVGLFAPARMRPELAKVIHGAFNRAVKQPEVGAQYAKAYMLPTTSASPEEFQKFVTGQIEQFKQIGDRAGIAVED